MIPKKNLPIANLIQQHIIASLSPRHRVNTVWQVFYRPALGQNFVDWNEPIHPAFIFFIYPESICLRLGTVLHEDKNLEGFR